MNNKKQEVLRILREKQGEFVSGQFLCEKLQVSRTAIWKYMSCLKEEGYTILSVPNKGYALRESPDVLSETEILSRMQTKCFGRRVYYYQETDSTNTRCKLLAEEGALEGSLVVAENQNAGKGRRGRNWVSQPGSGIWMTLLLRPDFDALYASSLTLVVAMAVAKAVEKQTGLPVQIKWPNDIVLHGKKICGILTEMSTAEGEIQYVVAGIGINVNHTFFPKEIAKIATSLQIESKKNYVRSELIAAVMYEMEKYYGMYLETKTVGPFLEEYNAYLANREREVAVLVGDINRQEVAYTGIAAGINEQGALLVRKEDGTVQQVLAGEVSVRGGYTYV